MRSFSYIQETRTPLFVRERTTVIPAKDAITVACHDVVNPIAKRPRHQTEEKRRSTPSPRESLKDVKNGVGTRQKELPRFVVIDHDKNGL